MVIDKRERSGFMTIKIPFNVLSNKEEEFLNELSKVIHDICDEYKATSNRIISLEIDNYE